VLVVSPLRGGYSETFIRAQMEGLPSRVEVLFGHWPQFETETGGPVMPRWVRRVRRVVRIASRGRGSEARLDLLWLAWYLRRRRVQIVLAQYGPTGAAWVRACKLLSLPLVTHFHGFDAYDEAVLQQQREAYKGLFAAGDAFVAVSRDMERQLVALGAPRMRVHYIPSGVDAERFRGARPASAPPRFISVGRFVEKKGQLLTLLAFRRLLDGAPDARLSLVGDGPLLDVCQQLASALDMSHAVEFAGVRTPNEIAEMFREARAYVQHSVRAPNGDSEGTPVAVLEAAVSGLPVIATRHGGIPDAIEDGASGYLVAEGDFERMAACMLQLARDPELAGAMGRRAREQVTAEFGQPKNLATLWELLVAVMNRRDGS
jgi:glycosyltransferase involved in cell wall biosynthesis